jgi:hypothetical protein
MKTHIFCFFALVAMAAGVACSSSSGSSSSGSTSSGGTDSGTPDDSGGSSSGGDSGGTKDSGGSSSGGDAGKLPFGSACTSSDQCVGGACETFPAKGGMFCTEQCPANPSDCPNGGAGCNGMGYCKVQ